MKRRLILLTACACLSICLHAQMEVAQLLSRNNSATGFGMFLHVGFPVSKSAELSSELGFYYFAPGSHHVITMPLLAGYRYFLNGSKTGFYLEPQAGYSFGGTDIEKTDAAGNPVYQGNEVVDQKASGITGALAAGYLFPAIPLHLGIRYTQIFVSGDPAQSVLSFRASYVVAFRRR